MKLECAVCMTLEQNEDYHTLERLVDPHFEVADAITIVRGTAVCYTHMPLFNDKVEKVAEEIIEKARRNAAPYWESEL